MSKIKPLARRNDIVIQELAHEILIYDLKKNKAYNLNESCALIWQLSNGDLTIVEIVENLSQKYRSNISEEFVLLALDQFNKEDLLENSFPDIEFFPGLTRRQIFRKVGLSTLVMLPMVSSIVAPNPVHAASSCPAANCRCGNSSTSCNGTTATVGGVSYSNCFSISGNNSSCNCVGPFNPNDSAGIGFKSSTVGCGSP